MRLAMWLCISRYSIKCPIINVTESNPRTAKKPNMTTSISATDDEMYFSDLQKKRDLFEELAAKHNLSEISEGLLLDDSDTFQIATSKPAADGSYRAIRLGMRDDITFELHPVHNVLYNIQDKDYPVYMSTPQKPVEGEDLLTLLQTILADKGVVFRMVNSTTCSFEFTAERTEFLFTCETYSSKFSEDRGPCMKLSFGHWDAIVDGVRYEKMRYV